ncbi:MAG TPA: DNA repair protein RecO [Anaerolineales bacterium]|nr:DNA repair protein RecO [Anaerolineales bacterium]
MREAHSFGVEAVVLRHSEYGEADRILTLFTRQRGKTRAIVRGVRRVTSRKAGHLEPFTHVKLQLAKGRDMPLITQAETVNAYLTLREDLVLTSQASYVVELVDRFTYDEGSDNSGIFRLLTDTLARLASRAEPWMAIRYYEMRLLDLLGFRPKLFECAMCGREIQAEDQFFSFAGGGVVCPTSAKEEGLRRSERQELRAISLEALRYLRHFQRSDYGNAARADPAPQIKQETETLMQGFLTHLLERELKTPGFLRQIRR